MPHNAIALRQGLDGAAIARLNKLVGNLCRCGTHGGIIRAVLRSSHATGRI